ncbi:exosortase A [Novosphingobium sp. BL-8H]|uniref:exosortase A n=1 Tax=Novosphingobium sp. BL-8H TaxID=3127640 RepID=UPI003757EB58
MPPDAGRLAPTLHMTMMPESWRPALVRVTVAWLALFAVFLPDWAAMARQWWDISTYNHVVLIPPILGWLVWQRRDELARLTPCVWAPGLIPFAGAGFLWLLGALSGLDLARQAGAVGLLAATVPLLLGPRVTAGLLFPLCYMGFLVPFGEELVEVLQTLTAAITVALTHLSGIDARIDGVFIDTPAGLFEVAEACSGVKFLIAMIAFGTLAANVCFVGWRRRALFMLACVVVPVLANGVRAWATIYAAQFVGAEKASGFDHIVYGWIFFALVLGAVIAASWRFFDRPVDAPMIDAACIQASPLLTRIEGRGKIPAFVALVAMAALVAALLLWARGADALAAPMPQRIDLPEVSGWHRVDYEPQIWWQPRAQGAEHRLLGRYADGAGREVDVFIAFYASQGEGSEAGGFGQGALTPDSPWAWQGAGPAFPDARSERLLGHGRVERLAVTWFRTGTMLSGSNAQLKLAVIRDHLLLRARPTMMLILSAEDRPGRPAQTAIARFLAATGNTGAWMDRVGQLR